MPFTESVLFLDFALYIHKINKMTWWIHNFYDYEVQWIYYYVIYVIVDKIKIWNNFMKIHTSSWDIFAANFDNIQITLHTDLNYLKICRYISILMRKSYSSFITLILIFLNDILMVSIFLYLPNLFELSRSALTQTKFNVLGSGIRDYSIILCIFSSIYICPFWNISRCYFVDVTQEQSDFHRF